jgi:hypothetical protein
LFFPFQCCFSVRNIQWQIYLILCFLFNTCRAKWPFATIFHYKAYWS